MIPSNGDVRALLVHDAGSGPELYAAGKFGSLGGLATNHVAKFDGVSWTPLATGLGGPASNFVSALAVHDEGFGPRLFAGGRFQQGGAVQANHVARWDGSSWSSLKSGTSDFVRSLVSYDSGQGARLYVGGRFTSAGGVSASRIARWDGAGWSNLGGGVNWTVQALAEFQGGLYVGGDFTSQPATGDAHLTRFAPPCSPPATYCTPKTSSAGCVSRISTSAPNAQPVSGAGNYDVLVNWVDGQKNGLVFASLNGPAAIPFLNGTLCVQPPIAKRGPVVHSGGNAGVCISTLATAVATGAVIPAGLDGGPGSTVWYQWWYRDPNNGPGNLGTALSDAIRLDFF